MQIVNHEVITAYRHWMLCREIYDRYYHSSRKATELRIDINEQLTAEVAAAEDGFEKAMEVTFKSQMSLQKEIDEINLDQIGLYL